MKVKTLIYKFLPIFLFFGLAACSNRVQTVQILQTSDIHGSIFPYDFIRNRASATSLAQVSNYVNHQRAQFPQAVVLLDNGDVLQGQPTVYFANFVDTLNHHLVSRAYNYMGYDAATYGNHDIEAGPAVYNRLAAESDFPWLAANVTSTVTNNCAFKPYTIIKRNGLKIAVIGLITPHIPHWLPRQLWPNMFFEDMVVSAKKWLSVVNEAEHPDIVVGLFHAGHDYTYGGTSDTTPFNENASLLVAQQTAGFDVIMIGHDHDAFCQKVPNANGDSVLVIDPAAHARFVAKTTVTVEKNCWGRIKSKTVNGELVAMDTVAADTQFMDLFNNDLQRVKAFVTQPIGTFAHTASSFRAFVEPTDFIDFIHRFQLQYTGADVSFTAPLAFVSTVKKGTVTVADMFKLYSFENFLNTMTLTGDEIDRYLEFNVAKWFNTMTGAGDHLLLFRRDSSGNIVRNRQGKPMLAHQYYNFDSAAGILYTVDVSKPAGQRVNITSMADGRPFKPEQTYVVAINSYRGNGGGGHLSQGVGLTHDQIHKRQIASTTHDLRLLMMQYIQNQGIVDPQPLNAWHLIPEKWVKPAANRDLDLLFNNQATEKFNKNR